MTVDDVRSVHKQALENLPDSRTLKELNFNLISNITQTIMEKDRAARSKK